MCIYLVRANSRRLVPIVIKNSPNLSMCKLIFDPYISSRDLSYVVIAAKTSQRRVHSRSIRSFTRTKRHSFAVFGEWFRLCFFFSLTQSALFSHRMFSSPSLSTVIRNSKIRRGWRLTRISTTQHSTSATSAASHWTPNEHWKCIWYNWTTLSISWNFNMTRNLVLLNFVALQQVVHSDQKRFKCQFCGSSFKRSKALKNHLILHSGLRPYACMWCDKVSAKLNYGSMLHVKTEFIRQ